MSDPIDPIVICYWDGNGAQVGDTVIIDETQRGVVRDVINSPEKMRAWGLDELGLMFDGVFCPERFLREFPVQLVSRAAS